MKGLGMLLVLMVLAIPAHAGFWVGPAVSYSWANENDFIDHNAVPALAVGMEFGALELKAQHPLDIMEPPNGWFRDGRYEVSAVYKLRF